MTRRLKWVVGLVFENFGWKLLALALALVIWALVASEPELATFATVRLDYKNLPDDLEISSDPVGAVVLELRGPSGELQQLQDGVRASVVLDMATVQPGERTFPIGDGNIKLTRGVHLVRAIPSEVRFSFEHSASRNVPVQVRFAGEGLHGYTVAQYEVNPSQLRITGPSSRVARITAAVTDPVDVGATVGSAEFHVNAFAEDPFVRFLSAPQVAVTVTMKKRK